MTIALSPGKRVLFLTKDPTLIRRQLAGELNLQMKDLRVEDLLDDINTDAMTPAWTCFDWRPADIARNAYAIASVLMSSSRSSTRRSFIDRSSVPASWRRKIGRAHV